MMSSKILISFAGHYAAGKDEAVKAILESKLAELDPIILSNSDPIREIASIITGIPAEDMNDQRMKNATLEWLNHKTLREVLITIGDGLRGEISPDVNLGKTVWSSISKNKFKNGVPGLYIKKDDRRPPEFDDTIELGGYLIYIENPHRPVNMMDEVEKHMEYAKLKAYKTIVNNMDKQFYQDIYDVIVEILKAEYPALIPHG